MFSLRKTKITKRGALLATISMITGSLISLTGATAANAATITVCASGCDQTSIQAAITAAANGDTINIGAGTYTTNLTVNKNVKLVGAGSGAGGTVITSAIANTPVIKITGSGASSSDLLTVSYMKITGATGSGNAGTGIYLAGGVAGDGTISNILIDHVLVTANGGNGVGINNTAAVTSVTISASSISSNTGAGIRVASAVPTLNGLTVSDSTVASNGLQGFDDNSSSANVTHTNFSFTNVTFSSNNASAANNIHDLSFFAFNGNATLTNVTVNLANSKAHGIVFNGYAAVSKAAAGNITLTNVTETGTVAKTALYFMNYSNLNNVVMSGVNVSAVAAGWVFQIDVADFAAGTLNLGDTTLKTIRDSGLGGNIDASSATFKNYSTGVTLDSTVLADAFQISKQIADATDSALLAGAVKIRTGHRYVTPTDALTGTVDGSLGRTIAVASAGDIVHVAAGTYSEGLTISKALTLEGSQSGVKPVSGGRPGGETVISSATPITVSSDDVTLDGFKLVATSTGVKVASPFSTSAYTRGSVKIQNNWIPLADDAAETSKFGVSSEPGTLTDFTIENNLITNADVSSSSSPIQLSQGTTAAEAVPTYQDLEISGNTLTGSGSSATCIALNPSMASYAISAATVTNNSFSSCGTAFNWANLANSDVTSNLFDGAVVSLTATNSTFVGNTLEGSAQLNVRDSSSLIITNNLFTGPNGISFNGASATIKNNGFTSEIDEESAVRIANLTGSDLYASYNYWGSASGRSSEDRVSGSVFTSPYLSTYVADPVLIGTNGFWPTEIAYVATIPAGTTSATVESPTVGQVDLGLIASELPIQVVLAEVTSPDESEAPFQIGTSAYFDLEITGLEEGTAVEICVPSAAPQRLWHYESGVWVDITTSYNAETKILCGSTSSFSPFALAPEKLDSTSTVSASVASASTTSSTYGQSVSVIANISEGEATGAVVVKIDSTQVDSCTVGTLSDCVYSTSDLSVGQHTFSVEYAGDDVYKASSDSLTFTVSQASSTTTATVSLDPSTYGDGGVDFEAAVSGVADHDAATGTVSFYIDGDSVDDYFGVCTLASSECSTASGALAAGTHTLYAVYSGDNNYTTSSDSVEFTVAKADAVVVTPNAFSLVYGNAPSGALYSVAGFVGEDDWVTAPTCVITNNTSSATPAFDATTPAGTYTLSCSGGDAGSNYETTDHSATATVTVEKASSVLDYIGDYFTESTRATLSASLSSACNAGAVVSFWYDSNADGTYETQIATASVVSGVASYVWTLPTNATMFEIEARFASDNCASAESAAVIVIGIAGDSSNGGGWYSQNGKVNFGYTVQVKTVKSVTTTSGQLVWITKSGYRLKATISSYSVTNCSGFSVTASKCGVISGTGYVSIWNSTSGSWVKQATAQSFTFKVADGGTSQVCSTVKKVTSCTTTAKPDYVAMQVSGYAISGESLTLAQLKGGNVSVK